MSKIETNTTSLRTIAEKVNDVNNEVITQADLIAQVAQAMQGKGVPGGSESEVQENAPVTFSYRAEETDYLPDIMYLHWANGELHFCWKYPSTLSGSFEINVALGHMVFIIPGTENNSGFVRSCSVTGDISCLRCWDEGAGGGTGGLAGGPFTQYTVHVVNGAGTIDIVTGFNGEGGGAIE